jgi:multiple sugar transport system permease protein
MTWSRWSGALFVAPYCAFFVMMLLIPLCVGIRLSMTRGDLFGIDAFVGFDNFARLFADPVFLQAVWNTFHFVLITVPAMTAIGLALALVLNRTSRLAAILRAIFFASTVLSVTVVALIWRLVLIPEGGLAAVRQGDWSSQLRSSVCRPWPCRQSQ